MPTTDSPDVPDAATPDVAALAATVGHEFADPSLLRRAMAHRSWCAETPGEQSNERLEFLGDAVLGWVIADIAFHRFDALAEGLLTDLRKSVVNAITLAEIAEEIGIGPYLLLGKGEASAGGAEKPSILSDAFEAVLGAVYLDGGTEPAYAMVERWVAPRHIDVGRPTRPTGSQDPTARARRTRWTRRAGVPRHVDGSGSCEVVHRHGVSRW